MAGRWKSLDRLIKAGAPLDMTKAGFGELALRVHEAVSASDTAGLRALVGQLAEAIEGGRRQAPSVAAAVGGPEPSREGAAHALGALGFAYQVTANALNRRAGDDFGDRLGSVTLGPYVRALAERDMSGAELAAATGRRPETVSRNLQELRAMGAVDCRREGTSLVNFLTSAARALVPQAKVAEVDGRGPMPEAVRDWVRSRMVTQAPIMRTIPSFSRSNGSMVDDQVSA